MVVYNMNGTSHSQHLNDLGLYVNGAAESLSQASDLTADKVMRNSEIVSHGDAILDLALIDYRTPQNDL